MIHLDPRYFLGGQACAVARGASLTLWLQARAANRMLRERMSPMAYPGLSEAHAAAVEECSQEIAAGLGVSAREIKTRQFIEVYPFSQSLAAELIGGSRWAVEQAARRLRQFESHQGIWADCVRLGLGDHIAAVPAVVVKGTA